LFERLQTPEEHNQFIADIVKAKRLRKEIAKLQMYRRIGIRSLSEAEKYELDKNRRQFHKMAQLQKEAEAKSQGPTTSLTGIADSAPAGSMAPSVETGDSLWKQYRTSDRKVRRSINRSGSGLSEDRLEKRFENEDKETPASIEQPSTSGEKIADRTDNTGTSDQKGEETRETLEALAAPVENKEAEGDKMDVEKSEDAADFDISCSKCYGLLSPKEAALCVKLRLLPVQYLEIKKALIHESLTRGLLDKEGPGSSRRIIIKIDIERRGDVVDFMVRAGWISSKLANAARNLAPVSAAE
jgi:hypothetical protein